MRVFMLGWEFPPFISGGLGTACFGLTKALSRQSAQVIFALPKAIGTDYATHVKLLAPQAAQAASGDRAPRSVASSYEVELTSGELSNVVFKAVPSRMLSPYPTGLAGGRVAVEQKEKVDAHKPMSVLAGDAGGGSFFRKPGEQYDGDMIAESQRYAQLCVDLSRGEDFDLIHAHDWMTFPAGLAVASATGRPLVVHVHSTEFDRSGDNVHQPIYEIERRGMHGAMRVVAVSRFTASIIRHHYGVDESKVEVVHNGIDNGALNSRPERYTIRRGDKIVLFLGRITMQKGPEYFVQAAKKVLEKMAGVKFVMAGAGDKTRDIIELAAQEGIGHKVLFTGFLRGPDVDRIFKMADVYVMPSVSEPFGIAPLEAISHDVPVIISKTSGVSEVLTHALKVDFWDTHEIANKILAVLRHPPLGSTLREHADMEVRRLTWDGAATRCQDVYRHAIGAMPN